jgi:transcriptional regulator with XRE-family HTH domain
MALGSPAERHVAGDPHTAVPYIERRRRELGMSREALAALAGVSARTVQYVEREGRRPHMRTLLGFAEALRCSVEDLVPPADEGHRAA